MIPLTNYDYSEGEQWGRDEIYPDEYGHLHIFRGFGHFFEPFERLLIRDFKGHLIHPSGFASQTKGIQTKLSTSLSLPSGNLT